MDGNLKHGKKLVILFLKSQKLKSIKQNDFSMKTLSSAPELVFLHTPFCLPELWCEPKRKKKKNNFSLHDRKDLGIFKENLVVFSVKICGNIQYTKEQSRWKEKVT